MVKKIIQVPVDSELLNCLDRVSNKQKRARAELIREACLVYLRQVEEEELDKIYSRGYENIPEKEDIGRAQAELSSGILQGEHW
jgi:metal-responsive CopG/Arc/MetJ family transcriptional regulator